MTYSAILESKEFKAGMFAKGPIASEGTVVLLSEWEGTEPLVQITTNYNPKMKEIRDSKCEWQTILDISWHTVGVEIEAKAKDYVSKFIVKMKIDTRVIDSSVIYRNWVLDMADYVKDILEGIVEEIACSLDIRDVVALKKSLYDKTKPCLQSEGVEISIKNITVDYDSETENYLTELRNTQRQKALFESKAEAANEIGQGLKGDIGTLIDILEGRLPASDIDDVRRMLRKHERDDVLEEITKKMEFLNQLIDSRMLSELDGQKAMKSELLRLGFVNQGHLQERESEQERESDVYAPLEEGKNP